MNQRFSGRTSKLVAATTLLACVLAVAAVSCKSLTQVPASLPTIADTGIVYTLNGAPPGAPTALDVYSGELLAADANFLFDVAFDFDSAGDVIYLPQRAVASGLANTHSVGLQTVPVLFDSLRSAPSNGYRADTALITKPNVTVVVQSANPTACSVSITGTVVYAKIVVTAVDPVKKQLSVKYTVNPNCGFRSFAPGIPTF